MIGEEALFKETALPYNVVTETECNFYVLDIAKLQSLCLENKFIKEMLTRRVDTKKEVIRRRMQPFMHMIKLLPNQQWLKELDEGKVAEKETVQKIQNLLSGETDNFNQNDLQPNRRGMKKFKKDLRNSLSREESPQKKEG